MALGSAAFAAANWAMTADLAPPQQAGRFFGLANVGVAGAAAAAGLFGPLVDAGNSFQPGLGFSAVFVIGALAFGLSVLALRPLGQAAAQPFAAQPAGARGVAPAD
jgi:hypothetical protein